MIAAPRGALPPRPGCLPVLVALLVPAAQRVGTPPADPARQTHAKTPTSSTLGSTPRPAPAPLPTPKMPPKPSPCKVTGHQFDSSDESDDGEST